MLPTITPWDGYRAIKSSSKHNKNHIWSSKMSENQHQIIWNGSKYSQESIKSPQAMKTAVRKCTHVQNKINISILWVKFLLKIASGGEGWSTKDGSK